MDDLQFWPSLWLFIIPEELVKTKGLSCQLEETVSKKCTFCLSFLSPIPMTLPLNSPNQLTVDQDVSQQFLATDHSATIPHILQCLIQKIENFFIEKIK